MKFKQDGKDISFDAFFKIYPVEGEILAQYQSEYEDLTFLISDEKLSLSYERYKAFDFDFKGKLNYHHRYFFKNSLYRDPLAKALGIKKGELRPRVLDSTAGSLGDSALIYSYGVQHLQLVERNPVVAVMALNSLKKYLDENVLFYCGDVRQIDLKEFDVAYFDPMYVEKNSKTAPKKEMAIFRSLVGADDDAYDVANFLFAKSRERLVIKRSNKAAPLLDNPSHTIKTKSTSYDVYLKKQKSISS